MYRSPKALTAEVTFVILAAFVNRLNVLLQTCCCSKCFITEFTFVIFAAFLKSMNMSFQTFWLFKCFTAEFTFVIFAAFVNSLKMSLQIPRSCKWLSTRVTFVTFWFCSHIWAWTLRSHRCRWSRFEFFFLFFWVEFSFNSTILKLGALILSELGLSVFSMTSLKLIKISLIKTNRASKPRNSQLTQAPETEILLARCRWQELKTTSGISKLWKM